MITKDHSQQRAKQAVIFDLDGVLVDTESLAFQAWRIWAAEHGGMLQDEDYSGLAGLTAEESAVYVMERTGLTFDLAESSAWAWQWVIDRMDEGAPPLPGSLELISALVARGYPLAIASNATALHVNNVLTGMGIQRYFPVRVGIDLVAQGKPAPDVYLLAAHCLSDAPSQCLAIEDSRVGVQAAYSAGMRVIAVPGIHDSHAGFIGAWRIYHSLLDVLADLDAVLAS